MLDEKELAVRYPRFTFLLSPPAALGSKQGSGSKGRVGEGGILLGAYADCVARKGVFPRLRPFSWALQVRYASG